MTDEIASETFVIDNQDGSVSLDAHHGMTREAANLALNLVVRQRTHWTTC